jgi:hypothetical protein
MDEKRSKKAMDVILPLSVMAFGLGFGVSQRTSIIASPVPTNEIGIASSFLALVRNIAGAWHFRVQHHPEQFKRKLPN